MNSQPAFARGPRILAGVTGLLIAGGVVFAATEPPPPSSPIVIKEISAEPIAFLDTTGPYWRIGGVLTEAFEYRRVNNLPGPVVVRYLQDPTRTAPHALQVQVAIVTGGRHETKPPFQSGLRDSEIVAARFIDSTSPEPHHEAALLAAWASENDYAPIGPLTEVYFNDLSNESTRVEIQLPVRKRVPPPVLPVTPILEARAGGDTTTAAALELRTAIAVAPFRGADPEAPSDTSTRAVATAVIDLSVPATPALVQPATLPAVTSEAIVGWLRQGEYDRIAELLIPRNPPLDSTSQLWIMQLVSRLAAAARGVEKSAVDSRGDLKGLHRAMVARSETAFGPAKPDPRDSGLLWARMQDEAGLGPKRAVVRECDVLLVRLAARSLDAQGLETALAGLLEHAIGVLQTK